MISLKVCMRLRLFMQISDTSIISRAAARIN